MTTTHAQVDDARVETSLERDVGVGGILLLKVGGGTRGVGVEHGENALDLDHGVDLSGERERKTSEKTDRNRQNQRRIPCG